MIHIKNTEYIIFDVETTGLSPSEGDRIVEIAAVKLKGNTIVAEFESLINPNRALPASAILVNGITQEMIQDAPVAAKVLPQLIDFIGGAAVVGHNVKFDLGFLCYELSLAGRKLRDETPAIDTLKMAKGLIPYLSSYRLEYLANALGVSVNVTHRALSDVKLTCEAFKRMLEMACDNQLIDFHLLIQRFGVEKPNFPIRQITQEMLF